MRGKGGLQVKALGLALLALISLALASCNTQSRVFTPDPKDPAYHCHEKSGAVIVDATWCFPVDGTHTCCYDNGTCIKPDPDGMSRGCAYPSISHEYGARPLGSRMSEQPAL